MKNSILKNGLIASALVVFFMVVTMFLWKNNSDFKPSAVYGFGGMLIAFTFIFIGIKSYRDKENNGSITFGKAFIIGFLIAFIASTFYVIAWILLYYNYIPNFMDMYSEVVVDDAKKAGESAIQIKAKLTEINIWKESYKSPVNVVLWTYVEILPLGTVVALISSLILMRKGKSVN
jgi:hypothetical protein